LNRLNWRAIVILAAAAFSSQAQTLNVLGQFNYSNGSTPATPHGASLVEGPDGNFYGTTSVGGDNTCGTVFQMTPAGAITTLHGFSYSVDGCSPESGVTLGSDGSLYGTTELSIFKITLSGAFTLLYMQGANGPHLLNGLIQASDGNFYGTASQGGTGNAGMIFSITPSGTFTPLINFSGTATGGAPQGPLIQASDGNLYGTTSAGGAVGADSGTVFKMTLDGTLTTIYSFCATSGCPDGDSPYTGLVQANDGNLYGTTQGSENGSGTIFKMTLGGTLTTLYTFCLQGLSSCPDGDSPLGSLIQGIDGNLYGTTSNEGMFNQAGTLFQITTSGTLTTLHQFCSQSGCADGSYPQGSLFQTSDGTLYGATNSGGANDFGVVFSLKPPAGPAYSCTNTTPPVISSIDSAGAYGGYPYFASGSWLEIFGSNLADPNDPRLDNSTHSGQWGSSDFTNGNAPTNLDGISVSINGKPAYVWFLSPGQINVQAPEDSATGSVAVTVTNCNATSSETMFTRRALAPGLLSPSNYSAGGKQYLVATFASDGAYVLDTSIGASFGLTSRPAKPGDLIIAYGIGFGDVNPSILPGVIVTQSNQVTNPVTFSFGSAQAELTYQGLAGSFVGLYEFYVKVPEGLADGDYQINVTENGTAVPQTFFLTVTN
jgi:uncharacterized protein (TIGR03437 family)